MSQDCPCFEFGEGVTALDAAVDGSEISLGGDGWEEDGVESAELFQGFCRFCRDFGLDEVDDGFGGCCSDCDDCCDESASGHGFGPPGLNLPGSGLVPLKFTSS